MNTLELWRLRWELKRSTKSYSKYVAEAKGEDRELRICEAMNYRNLILDKILMLRSMHLSDKAEILGIPVPPLNDKDAWRNGLLPGTVHLSTSAQLSLNEAIRKEQRERWSFPAFILRDIMTPLIGVLGAVTGLLAVIHLFHSK